LLQVASHQNQKQKIKKKERNDEDGNSDEKGTIYEDLYFVLIMKYWL
jgi:hypothetical protein